MKRIFIAIKTEPEETFLNIISSLKAGLERDSIKWAKVENIHITLAFLGNTEDSIINNLIRMLEEKCKGLTPFDLKMKGTGVFKNYSDPKIIWIGVEQSERLSELYEVVLSGLKVLNIDLGDKPFNPHITLGRIKHLHDKIAFRNVLEQFRNTEIQKVPVNEVILFESVLYPSGPVYTPIKMITLPHPISNSRQSNENLRP
jgi:2'-5' RNA ligase